MPRLSLDTLHELSRRALSRAGAEDEMAQATASALVYADARGLAAHGVARVPQYAAHLKNGRADGRARAKVVAARGGAALVDAGSGLAFPACALAVAQAVERSGEFGAAGLAGLAFGNSPAAIPAAGGKRPLFGTNPIAAIFPRAKEPPILIDLSLTAVARGKLMIAANGGQSIPLGWALDKDGAPTTDPRAGLEGSMLALGGAKGAMLALIVELLVTTLTGAAIGFEATSFFVEQGNRPRLGQAFLVIDPAAFAGRAVYDERTDALVAAMTADPDVRLPGERRHALAIRAAEEGVEIGETLYRELTALATGRA